LEEKFYYINYNTFFNLCKNFKEKKMEMEEIIKKAKAVWHIICQWLDDGENLNNLALIACGGLFIAGLFLIVNGALWGVIIIIAGFFLTRIFWKK